MSKTPRDEQIAKLASEYIENQFFKDGCAGEDYKSTLATVFKAGIHAAQELHAAKLEAAWPDNEEIARNGRGAVHEWDDAIDWLKAQVMERMK